MDKNLKNRIQEILQSNNGIQAFVVESNPGGGYGSSHVGPLQPNTRPNNGGSSSGGSSSNNNSSSSTNTSTADTTTATNNTTTSTEKTYEENQQKERDNNALTRFEETLRTKIAGGEGYSVDEQGNRMFGAPHQFLETTDKRLTANNNFGYCFMKDIFMEKPVVSLMPGKTNYLPDYSKADADLFKSLSTDDSDDAKSALEELVSDHGETRYYDFESDYTTYMTYVNLLCQTASIFLGIQDKKGPNGRKYRTYNWSSYQIFNDPVQIDFGNGIFKMVDDLAEYTKTLTSEIATDAFVGYNRYVNFYVDPSTAVNESISNSTQQSSLESTFDSIEGLVKEAAMFSAADQGGFVSDMIGMGKDLVGGLMNVVSLGVFKKLLKTTETHVLNGSNIIFPDIWNDSEYSKSFNISINLVSPYGNTEAVYLNIIVPLIHLLCLSLPRQTSANSFGMPFLIRGSAPGMFSIDMGIVESITIEKGSDQTWTVTGLPTQVKVSLQIKDLYGNLMIPPANKPSLFFSNQGMLDYLGCMCGIDLTKPNIIFKLKTLKAMLDSTVVNSFNTGYASLMESFKNVLSNFNL